MDKVINKINAAINDYQGAVRNADNALGQGKQKKMKDPCRDAIDKARDGKDKAKEALGVIKEAKESCK